MSIEMFCFKEEVKIDDINKMFCDDFLKHQIILYVKANLTKKQLHNFRRKIKDKSFYPVYIIRENQNDTEQIKQNKLQSIAKENKKLFKQRYRQVAYTTFGVSSLFDAKEKIKKCPFCKCEKLHITHNYTKEHTDCTLLFTCNYCNQILDHKIFFSVIDAAYVYNKTIENYLNLYCKDYGNKLIEKNIFDALENTEIVTFLACQ